MTLTQVLVTALAFVVAGVAKGAIGMGLPPIVIGIMSFAVPLENAIAMMVVPSMATNIWQAIYGGNFMRLMARFRTMKPPWERTTCSRSIARQQSRISPRHPSTTTRCSTRITLRLTTMKPT